MSLQSRTSNPAFRAFAADTMSWSRAGAGTMTVQGTAIKTLALTAILMVTAAWGWFGIERGDMAASVLVGAMIVGFATALITIFRPAVAPYTAPLYAAAEGVLLGVISHLFNARYQGIVVNAASLTMMTLFVILLLYSNRWITVTDKLRTGIVAATGAIALVYLVSMVLNFFGYTMPYIHSSGPIGIIFSLFVVGLAAFNLLLDFDFIERGAYQGLPRSMEWYGAFGLMITLIWLYLEILRLLSKMQDRR